MEQEPAMDNLPLPFVSARASLQQIEIGDYLALWILNSSCEHKNLSILEMPLASFLACYAVPSYWIIV